MFTCLKLLCIYIYVYIQFVENYVYDRENGEETGRVSVWI